MPIAVKNDEIFTYGDYVTWPDDERWELIDGVAYNMGPAPTRWHQEIFGALFGELYLYLKGKKCKVYAAPFDVRFPEGKEKDDRVLTVVQPDISVICDKKKLDDKGCRGAPDLVIEILSPSTASKDVKEKFFLYQKHGVKEYWIIHPDEKIIEVFKSDKKGKYGAPEMYSFDDEIKVGIFKELVIDLKDIL
ncbi:MAG: Uma2 family endonuclease [bacterium]|nr:Uma2 family endonuclease [bacterium]